MIKYISTSSEKHFLLFIIRIGINFQSRSVVRNSNKVIKFNIYKIKDVLLKTTTAEPKYMCCCSNLVIMIDFRF